MVRYIKKSENKNWELIMKNNKSLIFKILLFLLVLLVPLFAGDGARNGTAGGVQVLIPVGPQALAMGGANTAVVNGVDAIFWNPAGLANMPNKFQSNVSTMKIFNSINVNYLALGANMGKLGN